MLQNYETLKGKIWLNNKFVKSNQSKLHVLSHGLHFSSVVFEGIRVYNKKAFKLSDHINRLFFSSKILEIKIPFKKSQIIKACQSVIREQNLINGYLRPVVWRGGQSMAPGIKNAKINLAIAGWEWPVYYSKDSKTKGISLTISSWRRPPNECAPTQSKCSGNYMICTLAKHNAEKKKFDDALMLDLDGNICETTSSNIFFIKKNTVFTPKATNFLNGITRKEVIKICKRNKIKIVEKKIKKQMIKTFDCCFITGTAAEITPVKKIDSFQFKNINKNYIKIFEKFTEIIKN